MAPSALGPRLATFLKPAKKPRKSGVTLAVCFSTALRALAEGCNCVITGLAFWEKLSSLFRVRRDSSRKVGRAMKVSRRS